MSLRGRQTNTNRSVMTPIMVGPLSRCSDAGCLWPLCVHSISQKKTVEIEEESIHTLGMKL